MMMFVDRTFVMQEWCKRVFGMGEHTYNHALMVVSLSTDFNYSPYF